jgi:hypothetical protein
MINSLIPLHLLSIQHHVKFLLAANISFNTSDGNNNDANGNPSINAGISNSNLLA